MRIGLFGGSFDPIHNGHILPVLEARRALALDRVLFLPTAAPPHKPGRVLAPAWSRFAMVELALLEVDGCFASPYEVTPGVATYTVDSVEHFRKQEPGAELFLILGADSLASFHLWRRWREILEAAELVVLRRPGWILDLDPDEASVELLRAIDEGRVHFVEHHPVAVSSTELRRSLAAGEELPAAAIPGLVLQYIHKYALYR